MGIVSGGGGGGGSRPVSVYVALSATALGNIHLGSLGSVPFLWDTAYDDTYNQNPILTLPSGLGLSFAIDGTGAGAVTTTAAGTWTFQLRLGLGNTDATLSGLLEINGIGLGAVYFGAGITKREQEYILWGETLALPAAATFTPRLALGVVATTLSNPESVEGLFTRLG